jgi:RimJ/RimL family protein N-acetyltransferase
VAGLAVQETTVHCPYLIGERIYLRPLERADAPIVQPWINDPEIRHNIRRYQPVNLQGEEEFIAKVNADERSLVLGIVLKDGDRLIGGTGLHDIDFRNRHASFGITIGVPAEQSKGHGTEATRLIVGHAFETLNLNRVWLQVYEDNLRGIRAYEKAGFRKEGILRQDVFRAGRYWDTIVMAILREEWVSDGSQKRG